MINSKENAVSFIANKMFNQMVKNLPEMQKTQPQSLGWEDPLQKGMATHSSILAWKIPWTGEPCGLQSMRSQRVEPKWAHTQTSPSLWAAPGLWHHHTHRPVSIGILKGNLLSLSFSCFVRWLFFPLEVPFSSFHTAPQRDTQVFIN